MSHGSAPTDSNPESSSRSHWLDYPAYFVLRLVLCAIQSIEIQRADRYCQLLARLFGNRLGIRRKLVHENLRRVFPNWSDRKIKRTEHGMWLHLLRLVCEASLARRKIHRTNWYEYFRMRNRPRMLNYMFDPRPKLLVTGHFGNFELSGFITGLFGLPSSTIARELDNRYIQDYLMEFRSAGGQHFVSKNAGAGVVQELLESGATLAFLADQEAGSRGVWVDFLGHPASCHKALALFTLSSGAPMMVSLNHRLGSMLSFELEMVDTIDPLQEHDPRLASVESITKWYNQCLENGIRKSPDQYWWVHRRWREPPPRLRKKANLVA